jgi:type IV secretory pathway VirD2 relaxase
MDDEPLIRLEPRKSKHGRNENPRKYTGVLRSMLRLVQMSKRGQKSHDAQGAGGEGGKVRATRTFNQRVAVRVSYSANKNPGQWKAHGRYIARESATKGGKAAEAGFNATEQNLNIPTTLDKWQSAGDERLFKIIVSPEFADRLNLQEHTRELMQRMGRDLGTEIEWVAAVHHNTEHPHIHIAVRGVDAKGIPFRLTREYIRGGLRERAEQIVTETLGYRSPADSQEAWRRETVQNRFTSLDRVLQRSNDRTSSYFRVTADPDDASLSEFAQELQKHLAARLMHLQTMGLAELVAPQEWSVQSDFETVLRTLQQSADRQKMLAAHGALVSDKRLPLQVTTLRQLETLTGRVLLHTEDEHTGKRYMLVEGTDGKVHLIYHTSVIEEARNQGRLAPERFIRLEKRFAGKKPGLHVEDLGDSNALFQNSSYFRREAELLIRRGIHDVQPVWGGWLGQYQTKLQAELRNLLSRNRGDSGRGGRSN